MGGAVAALAMTFSVGFIAGRSNAAPTVVADIPAPPSAAVSATPAPTTPAEPVARAPQKVPATWKEAMVTFKPRDAHDEFDPGAGAFARWAAERLVWADVAVTEDETTVARVLKDSETERGKRLCAGVTVVEITTSGSGPTRVFVGGAVTGAANVLRFYAIGSTGDLVQRSQGRFCGIVMGRESYANSSGGMTHGIRVVGMFDLPENRSRTTPGGTTVKLDDL